MTRLYVSGPMSGLPENNFPAFNQAAAQLRAVGYDVVNPAERDLPADLEWATYLKHDLADLVWCGGVALLPGWMDSRGARLEVHVARELGLRILRLDEWIDRAVEAKRGAA